MTCTSCVSSASPAACWAASSVASPSLVVIGSATVVAPAPDSRSIQEISASGQPSSSLATCRGATTTSGDVAIDSYSPRATPGLETRCVHMLESGTQRSGVSSSPRLLTTSAGGIAVTSAVMQVPSTDNSSLSATSESTSAMPGEAATETGSDPSQVA